MTSSPIVPRHGHVPRERVALLRSVPGRPAKRHPAGPANRAARRARRAGSVERSAALSLRLVAREPRCWRRSASRRRAARIESVGRKADGVPRARGAQANHPAKVTKRCNIRAKRVCACLLSGLGDCVTAGDNARTLRGSARTAAWSVGRDGRVAGARIVGRRGFSDFGDDDVGSGVAPNDAH